MTINPEIGNLEINMFFNYNVIVKAFNRLINLLDQDEGLITKSNADNILQTLDERKDLINFLSRQKDIIAQHPELKNSLTEEQKTTLLDLTTKLQQISNKSSREISKAIFINEKLLNLVAKIVSKEKSKSIGYSRTGVKSNTLKFKEAPSVALNENL